MVDTVKLTQNFGGETSHRKEFMLEDQEVDGRIILRFVFVRYLMKCRNLHQHMTNKL